MDAHSKSPTRRKKLAYSLLGTVCFLGLAEITLRLVPSNDERGSHRGFTHFPAEVPPILWNGDEDRNLKRGIGMFMEDRAQLWVPRPGVEVPYGDLEKEHINSAGFRGPERTPRPAAGVLRVVALGDSSTFGMGVAYPDTWCAQLEAALGAQGVRAEVLDAGVIGFTIEQGLERYDALVHGLSPDIVIAAFGAINEHMWAQTSADRPKIDERKRSRPVHKALRELRYNVRLLHLAAWVVDRARGEDREAMREEWKQKRREQDAFNVGVGQPDWPGVRRVGLERFAAALNELDSRVRADRARLVLVSMPRLPERETDAPVLPLYNKAVEDAGARLGAQVFDARTAALGALRGPPAREWSELFLDAYHPTRAGHGLIAAGLVPIVKALAAEPRANSPASSH